VPSVASLLEFPPRRHSSAVEQLFRKQQVLGSNPSVGSSDLDVRPGFAAGSPAARASTAAGKPKDKDLTSCKRALANDRSGADVADPTADTATIQGDAIDGSATSGTSRVKTLP
jgi:hypothetical protein